MTRKCSTCKKDETETYFTKKQQMCRPCKSEYDKVYNKKKSLEYKIWLKDKGCMCCGFNNPDAMEVHHLGKEYKRFGSSQASNYNIDDVDKGVAIVLCANCHLIFHNYFGGRALKFPTQTIESTIEIINNSRRLQS